MLDNELYLLLLISHVTTWHQTHLVTLRRLGSPALDYRPILHADQNCTMFVCTTSLYANVFHESHFDVVVQGLQKMQVVCCKRTHRSSNTARSPQILVLSDLGCMAITSGSLSDLLSMHQIPGSAFQLLCPLATLWAQHCRHLSRLGWQLIGRVGQMKRWGNTACSSTSCLQQHAPTPAVLAPHVRHLTPTALYAWSATTFQHLHLQVQLCHLHRIAVWQI